MSLPEAPRLVRLLEALVLQHLPVRRRDAMHRQEGRGIVNNLSRGSRIVLSITSGLAGLVMVVAAPPSDKAQGFYFVALICLLLCIACISDTRIRRFLGGCIGTVLFAASLWYGYARFGQLEFFNALVFFVVFGLPGVAYAVSTRFGFWRKRVDVLAGADNPNRLQQPNPFYNREPWNFVVAIAVAVAVAYSIALAASPWLLLVPLVVIYESQFAGTNQATAVTWTLGEHFDDMVRALDAKGVPFEHYVMPGIVLAGHVHVVHEGSPSRVAWFKDPDGNLHNLNNGSPAPAE
jgi:hypothetical protein